MVDEKAQEMREFPDLSGTSEEAWQLGLRDYVRASGDYIALDDAHVVLQAGDGDKLLVTFEHAADIRKNNERAMPFGLSAAEALGVCVVTVLCLQPTWYRAPAVYEFFDALTDDGVFEDFDHVLFYGVGMGGYGAAAFSVAHPGSDVIVVSPQATLDPRVTEWDPRFPSMRKRSFTDRYGFAPDMCGASRHTLVLYNPDEDLNAMHAALFARPGITRFRCRHMGRNIHGALADLDILHQVMALGLEAQLDLLSFAQLYRRRRDYAPYLRALLSETEDQDRPKLTLWLAGSVLPRKNMPRMRRALERLSADAQSAAE